MKVFIGCTERASRSLAEDMPDMISHAVVDSFAPGLVPEPLSFM
jgi:hypothetical protein